MMKNPAFERPLFWGGMRMAVTISLEGRWLPRNDINLRCAVWLLIATQCLDSPSCRSLPSKHQRWHYLLLLSLSITTLVASSGAWLSFAPLAKLKGGYLEDSIDCRRRSTQQIINHFLKVGIHHLFRWWKILSSTHTSSRDFWLLVLSRDQPHSEKLLTDHRFDFPRWRSFKNEDFPQFSDMPALGSDFTVSSVLPSTHPKMFHGCLIKQPCLCI